MSKNNSMELRQNKDKELILQKLKQTPIIEVVCQKIGIARATFYRWKKSDKKFREAVEVAIDEGINLINELAESQLISAIKDKNLTSIIFWLKTHHSTYSPRLEVTTKDESKLSKEQELMIIKAIKLISINNVEVQNEQKN